MQKRFGVGRGADRIWVSRLNRGGLGSSEEVAGVVAEYGDVVGMAAAAAAAFELFTAPALQSMSTRSKGVECTACELHAGDLSISRTFLQRNLRKQRANPTGELSVVLNVLCSLSQSFADFEECNFSP